MGRDIPIYIATVCLEKNRWKIREPSFKVSRWIERFAADGFEGVELWEFHYIRGDDIEQEKLRRLKMPLIYNSYVEFSDNDAENRFIAAKAIRDLGAHSVKYNLGKDATKLDEYRRNLKSWADALPSSCRLLCECHAGTIMEDINIAFEFHRELDADRFGIIVHPMENPEKFRDWLKTFKRRVCELHMQFRTEDSDPSNEAGHDKLMTCARIAKEYDFRGILTIEFTRGIGQNEQIEEIYSNACMDLRACQKIF